MYEILIIDDDLVDRRITRNVLTASTLETRVHEADSAESGFELIGKHAYDCVLLDLQLPDMNGIELLHRLAQLDGTHRPAVVMLTGTGNERAAVQAMKLGVQDYLIKGELAPAEAEQAILRALESHREEQARSAENSRLLQLALVDPLTGLGNRNMLEGCLDQALRRARRERTPVCILLMDLDGFKAINDVHGHLAGDHVLQVVGARLREVSRDSDTVARLGGDEFVVIMETGVTREGADVLASRIREVVATPIEQDGAELHVGCCVGVAFTPNGQDPVVDLLRAADDAMYAEKRSRADGRAATMLRSGTR